MFHHKDVVQDPHRITKQGRLLPLFFTVLILSSFLMPPGASALSGISDKALKKLYGSGQYKEVVEALAGSEDWNSEQSLYLGLSHLRLGNPLQTIRAWQHYVRLEKGSEGGRKISQYLTQLLKQEATQNAKEQINREKQLAIQLDPKAIAVYPFENKGSETYAPLSKGLAAMIITDLSKVKGLTVVERIQLQAVLNELKIAKSGIVNPLSAPSAGKLVGAAKFTTGSILDLDEEKMRIDAKVTHTESGKQVSAVDTAGELASFYTLEKMLVFKLLCGLGYCPESLDNQTRLAIDKIHTKNFKAFQHFSEGLDFFDEANYREAARSFVLALEEDPNFELARKALLETPLLRLTIDQMIAGAESINKNTDLQFRFEAAGSVTPNIRIVNPVIPPPYCTTCTSAGGTTVPVEIQIDFP